MNNDWIIWNGGDCPVSPDTIVQAQFRRRTRNESEDYSPNMAAGKQTWGWCGSDHDIIAYRIITEPLWAEWTVRVSDFGRAWVDDLGPRGTHLLRIPMKLIDGKRIIDDSRHPVMEKL